MTAVPTRRGVQMPLRPHSARPWRQRKRCKSLARADFLLAPTRATRFKLLVTAPPAMSGLSHGALQELVVKLLGKVTALERHHCRAARGDRAVERPEGPPGHQAEWNGEGNHAEAATTRQASGTWQVCTAG
jgi:hypothetical protein